jgi:hypothetical protein
MGVVGRDRELAAIGQFLEGEDLPCVLLIEGEAGIGKTTLWRAGIEAARELSYGVLSASRCSQSFPGLNDERSRSHSS